MEFNDLSTNGKIKYIIHKTGKDRILQFILVFTTLLILVLSSIHIRLLFIIFLIGLYIWFYQPNLLKEA